MVVEVMKPSLRVRDFFHRESSMHCHVQSDEETLRNTTELVYVIIADGKIDTMNEHKGTFFSSNLSAHSAVKYYNPIFESYVN